MGSMSLGGVRRELVASFYMWGHSYRGCGVVRREGEEDVGMCVPLARMAVEATSEA